MNDSHLSPSAYCERIYCLERAVSENTQYLLSLSCRMLERWHIAPLTVGQLCDDIASRWIRDLEAMVREDGKRAFSPRTVHGRRGDLLCIWRYAYYRGDCERLPCRVRGVKVPTYNPQAWTMDELAKIVGACKSFPGHLGNGIPRRLYFPALIAFVYETGLRRSDVWRVRLDQMHDDGSVIVSQHKTGKPHVARVHAQTLQAVRAIGSLLEAMGDSRADQPLRWPHTPKMLYNWIERARQRAGVKRDGALQQLRRSGATHVEREERGAATQYLGHATPELARKHYIDASLAYPVRPLPPAIQPE